eukprot:13725-Rhodomonas_salina.1
MIQVEHRRRDHSGCDGDLRVTCCPCRPACQPECLSVVVGNVPGPSAYNTGVPSHCSPIEPLEAVVRPYENWFLIACNLKARLRSRRASHEP